MEEVLLLLSQWIFVQVFHLLMSYPEVFMLLTTGQKERKIERKEGKGNVSAVKAAAPLW